MRRKMKPAVNAPQATPRYVFQFCAGSRQQAASGRQQAAGSRGQAAGGRQQAQAARGFGTGFVSLHPAGCNRFAIVLQSFCKFFFPFLLETRAQTNTAQRGRPGAGPSAEARPPAPAGVEIRAFSASWKPLGGVPGWRARVLQIDPRFFRCWQRLALYGALGTPRLVTSGVRRGRRSCSLMVDS